MKKAIYTKEWLKTRLSFFLSCSMAVAVAVYAVLSMNRLIELKGVDHFWLIMLLKDNMFVDILKYTPVLIGIAIGVSQMVPEMSQKRLKLTLHLPFSQNKLIALMLSVGLLELLGVFLLQLSIIYIYDSSILPYELVNRVLLTTLPWYFAGFTAYLFTAAICLEGTWKMRIILGLLCVSILMLYFLQPTPEAYNGMVLIIILFSLLLTLLSFGSVIRFKEGHQN